MFRCLLSVFILFIVLTAFSRTLADSEETGFDIDLYSLSIEELVKIRVTLPTKTPLTIDKGPASITVFTSKEIRALGAQYLSELLNLVPGFDVRRFREPLNQVDVRGISGQFNERILVMMDGVRMNDIYNGGISRTARAIRMDNVDRVEILRGPGSVLYGTDAFAAVINILTKKGSEVDGTSVGGTFGSFDTYGASFLTGNNWGPHELQVSFSYMESGGDTYDIKADATGRSGKVIDEFDESSVSIRYDYGSKLSLALSGGQREERGFISLSDLLADKDDKNQGSWLTTTLDVGRELSDAVDWDTKFYGAYNQWDVVVAIWPAGYGPAANPEGPFPDGMYGHPWFDDWRYGINSSLNLTLSEGHNAIVGIAVEQEETANEDHISNGSPIGSAPEIDGGFFEDHQRDIFAGYCQYSGAISEILMINAGVRYDHYDDFGCTVNPRASLVITPVENLYGKFIFNRAFRAPTFRELYGSNPVVLGDKDNEAETIETFEVVLGYKSLPRFSGTLSLFYNKIDDIIALQGVEAQPGISIYQNRSKANTYGIETELMAQITDRTTLIGNYTHINGELTADQKDYDLPFIASDIANLMLVQNLGNWAQATLTTQYRSEHGRDDALGDPRPKVDGYLLTNLYFRMFNLPKEGFEWFVSLKNIFDENYGFPSHYPPKVAGVSADDIPGRRFQAVTGLRYTFGGD